MYYRIKNRLDAECMSRFLIEQSKNNQVLADRIVCIAKMLDDAYGETREAHAMGGYILLFPNEEAYADVIHNVMDFYGLNADLYEYADVIDNRDGQEWQEKLFLLSSDDALVLIYPREEPNA